METKDAKTSTPHDTYFKHVFERPADAASALRSVLPKPLADRVDWSTLQPYKGSFPTEKLQELHCDLVFQARLIGTGPVIYFHMEHQSSVDQSMPLRMMQYALNIWNHHWKSRTDAAPLPIVTSRQLTYIMGVGDTPFSEIKPIINQLGTKAQEAIMTIAETLRTEGRTEGRAATLLEQLAAKFGDLPESVRRAVTNAGLDDLETWTTRILTADTIDGVFA